MSAKPTTMLEDEREISVVNDEKAGMTIASVGSRGVTRIACYGEPGDNAFRPWLAIYVGDEIVQRIDASGLSVYYASTVERQK